MQINLKYILFLLSIFTYLPCFAQTQIDEPQNLESMYEEALIENESKAEFDVLEYFIEHRLCLNTTSADALSQLPVITYNTALKIIDLVQNKVLKTYTEIFDSLRLSDNEMYVLRKSTYLLGEIGSDKSQFNFRFRNKMNFEKVKGFKENIYEGNPIDYFSRLRFTSNNISAGLIIAKDAGEIYFNDFLSGFILLDIDGIKMILGDFYVKSGMGNILWNNFGSRKGYETIYPPLQFDNRILPYNSNYESNFMRGVAFKYNIGTINLNLSGWISNNYLSGNIDTIDNICTSVYTSGYFRTKLEIEKKEKINEKIIGGSLEWDSSPISIGSSGIFIQYNLPLNSTSSSVFWGSSGFLGTLYTRAKFDNISAIAELSIDNNNNLAIKSALGVQTSAFDAAFSYRYIHPKFRSPFGYNFGENSYLSNETGFYTGIRWKPTRAYCFSAYTDIYRTLTGTFVVPIPTRGLDLFSQLDYKFNINTKTSFRLRYENKTDVINDMSQIKIYQKSKTSFRIDNNYKASEKINLRFRFEAANIAFESIKNDEFGLACFGEISWLLFDVFEIGSRVNIYSTDSYESSIWQFEYTTPGFITIQPQYGDGIRTYIYATFTPFINLQLHVKYSSMFKNNVDFIGTGYEEVKGNAKSDLIIQLDYKL